MQNLTIKNAGEVVIIRGVAFADLPALSTLTTEIQSLWMKHGTSIGELLLSNDFDLFKDLAQKIANLHPRIDTPGQKGFPIEPLLDDLDQLEALFFLQRDEADDRLSLTRSGLILRLNRLDAEKKLQAAMELLQKQEEAQVTPSPASSPDLPLTSENVVAMPQPKTSSRTSRSGSSKTSVAS